MKWVAFPFCPRSLNRSVPLAARTSYSEITASNLPIPRATMAWDTLVQASTLSLLSRYSSSLVPLRNAGSPSTRRTLCIQRRPPGADS